MKKFFQEFKKFITRGNILDLAVGVIVGGAFTAIVTSLTNNIIRPFINWIILLIGGKQGLSSAYTFLSRAYTINADGKRLYRVLENLLSNISKYSLNNTRVYIDIEKEHEKLRLIMKNISSYELNFDSDEIMERFKRGDESRNTEGSGLGLAIARDLVKIF